MINEIDKDLANLLDELLADVEVPTDEEAEEAKDLQQGNDFIL